ncbi:transposase [Rhizobium pisi]
MDACWKRMAEPGIGCVNEISIIGLDLAKNVFQVHGSGPDGRVALRKKLSRGRLLEFFADLPICAHYWGREIGKLEHEVRLINPSYVKPFIKRQKNDAADAEAIAEAAARPTMRYVSVKSAEKQASSMAFKVRDLLVRQRTQTINALRGHLMEYGLIVPQGIKYIALAREQISTQPNLPEVWRVLCNGLLDQIVFLSGQICRAGEGATHACPTR